jgi:ADP-dependent NAD(P)H-hydrate dehydratase
MTMDDRHDDTSTEPRLLDDATLREWALPMPATDEDKHGRGRVLVVAGSPEMPGAAILAAEAALRAGAGKLVIATAQSVAGVVALAVPEARVIGLPETQAGGLDPSSVTSLSEVAENSDAVLIGPGMQDEAATCALVAKLMPALGQTATILDALAMSQVCDPGSARETEVLLTPHAGEMAHLLGEDKSTIEEQADARAIRASMRWNAIVALKGATTFIATPGKRTWRHDGGNVGLAISGSGDVLAGIITGLAARGATLEQAAAWGVALHARAGQQLAKRIGPLGYLAREILFEIPGLMQALARR